LTKASTAAIKATANFMVSAMVKHKLTDVKVRGLKRPGMYSDGAGLYIRLHATGSKSWFFVYTRGGVRRELGLGGLEGTAPVGLAWARKKADELREILAEGRDPYAERTVRKARALTFRDVAERYMTDKGDWKAHTEKEWKRHLFEHAAAIGKVRVDAVNTELVEAVLRPLWREKPATGQRVRGKIEAVLDYAGAKRLRTGENPARWVGNLEHILTEASRVTGANHAAMPYADVPAFVSSLNDDMVPRCIKFVILTAVRSGEARLADWSEFDLDEKLWTIPAERTKTKKELIVPLTDAAIAALPEKGEGWVFRGRKPKTPLALMSMPSWITTNKPGVTMHGFRSAFRDWVGDKTECPREIAEMALGHQVGNAVEQAYRRGDALQKRRALMKDWADYCAPL
jgi:integrase